MNKGGCAASGAGRAELLLPFHFFPARLSKPAGKSRARQPAVCPKPCLARRGGRRPALPCCLCALPGCCSVGAEPEPAPRCSPSPLGSCCHQAGLQRAVAS